MVPHMPHPLGRRSILGLLAAAFVGLCPGDADALADAGGRVAQLGALAFAAQADVADRPVNGFAKSATQLVRRSWRTVRWMYTWATRWWADWVRRAASSIAVAVVAALADIGLLNAFRTEGLRALVTYVPLMLYVYGRLFFSRGVSLAPKLLLIGTLAYGAVHRDLLPDNRLSGRLEDIVLIVIATRAFLYACPEELVNQFAASAVGWRRRVASLQNRPR